MIMTYDDRIKEVQQLLSELPKIGLNVHLLPGDVILIENEFPGERSRLVACLIGRGYVTPSNISLNRMRTLWQKLWYMNDDTKCTEWVTINGDSSDDYNPVHYRSRNVFVTSEDGLSTHQIETVRRVRVQLEDQLFELLEKKWLSPTGSMEQVK